MCCTSLPTTHNWNSGTAKVSCSMLCCDITFRAQLAFTECTSSVSEFKWCRVTTNWIYIFCNKIVSKFFCKPYKVFQKNRQRQKSSDIPVMEVGMRLFDISRHSDDEKTETEKGIYTWSMHPLGEDRLTMLLSTILSSKRCGPEPAQLERSVSPRAGKIELK